MDSNTNIETYTWEDRTRVESHPQLEIGALHIWHRAVVPGDSDLESLYDVLSEDERTRAGRFAFEDHRSEFILSRGTLRVLLASYLGTRPDQLRFVYSTHGKPSLSQALSNFDLRFNVSHSGRKAVFAFVRGFEIGVDIEEIRADVDTRELAERLFSAREMEQLSTLTGESLHSAFFRCWTRKEAFIKAKGQGLSIPLREFDVSLLENEPAALLGTRPDPLEASRWSLHDLVFEVNYAGALAVERAVFRQPEL